jgi:hypothetical protein
VLIACNAAAVCWHGGRVSQREPALTFAFPGLAICFRARGSWPAAGKRWRTNFRLPTALLVTELALWVLAPHPALMPCRSSAVEQHGQEKLRVRVQGWHSLSAVSAAQGALSLPRVLGATTLPICLQSAAFPAPRRTPVTQG